MSFKMEKVISWFILFWWKMHYTDKWYTVTIMVKECHNMPFVSNCIIVRQWHLIWFISEFPINVCLTCKFQRVDCTLLQDLWVKRSQVFYARCTVRLHKYLLGLNWLITSVLKNLILSPVHLDLENDLICVAWGHAAWGLTIITINKNK